MRWDIEELLYSKPDKIVFAPECLCVVRSTLWWRETILALKQDKEQEGMVAIQVWEGWTVL